MKPIKRLFRLIYINAILIRYNIDDILFKTPWFYPLRFLNYFNPWHWYLKKRVSRGVRLRCALEALGPIFIKAGQIISTRRDLLPDDIADELAKLQDQVPPFCGLLARQIIESALHAKIADVFSEFNNEALASASIAQVHAATLLDGTNVVVKVLRPNIKKIVERDLDLLTGIAHFANRYWKEGRRFKPKEIVAEITHTLKDELDLTCEGANASQLRRHFANSPLLYIPEIYWAYSRSNVLVMERIYGIPIYNIPALKAAGYNMKKIAERGVEIFFTQVFRDSFFHADMHPGNIFIAEGQTDNPRFIAVDFGIMGSLTTEDQRYLAENLLAFFKRDYRRVAELHVSSGWLPPDTRIDLFESAIRAVCEPIFERPLKDISFGHLLLRLFQTARRFNINIQPQLILLQKTLFNIEGVGRQLYPELDLWNTASPYLEKWLRNQVGVKGFVRRIRENLPYWSEKLPDIPGLIYDVLNETRTQKDRARYKTQTMLPSNRSKTPSHYIMLGLGSAFVISSVLLYFTQFVMTPFMLSLGGIGFLCVFLAALFN